MLRGKIDRIVIIILSILPRSILFILLNTIVTIRCRNVWPLQGLCGEKYKDYSRKHSQMRSAFSS